MYVPTDRRGPWGITNTQRILGVMIRGRWDTRADQDPMLQVVALDYEAVKDHPDRSQNRLFSCDGSVGGSL